MRYFIFSDVHGNREAFEAVMGELSKERADRHIFLGDVVGYGADPVACINGLKALKPDLLISGNHEWGVLGLLDAGYFNEYAAFAIGWTKGMLAEEELSYVRSFELVHRAVGYSFVHGSFDEPSEFKYIHDGADASIAMKFSGAPLSFAAHTHVAGAHFSDKGRIAYSSGPKIPIEPGKSYVINAGSVGQPRDGDPRASYLIYDDEESAVEIKRVVYDVKTAQDKIMRSGLPEFLASRLAEGR